MEHVSGWQIRDREAIILIPILWRDVDMLTHISAEGIQDIERFVYMEEFFQL